MHGKLSLFILSILGLPEHDECIRQPLYWFILVSQ